MKVSHSPRTMEDIKQFPIDAAHAQGAGSQALIDLVAEVTGAVAAPPEAIECVYLDTFDWRLYAADSVLEAVRDSRGWALTWSVLGDGRTLGRLSADQRPVFASDIEPAPARARLAATMDIRALMERVRVRLNRQPLALRNDDDKTVVRLALVEGTAIDPETGDEATLSARVTVQPVRGYDKAYDRIVTRLTDRFGAAVETGPLMVSALAAIGRTPGDYSSKIRLALARGTPAETALKDVCQTLLRVMERNVDGVLADTDSEFLHDFRVAVRRTRTALTQAKGVFPEAMRRRFADDFKWLGQLTGPKRDLDVFRLDVPGYQNRLPDDQAGALAPFQDFLDRRAQAALADLARALRSERYRRLVGDWRDMLHSPTPPVDPPPEAHTPIERLAARRIARAHKRVIKDGRRIDAQSPPEALHDLRKDAKKLRYQLEFFRSLFDADDVKTTVKALKQLQAVLGTYQDSAVQREALMAFGRAMTAETSPPPETLMALGTLTATLEDRQADARAHFADRFAAFDTADVADRIAHMSRDAEAAAKPPAPPPDRPPRAAGSKADKKAMRTATASKAKSETKTGKDKADKTKKPKKASKAKTGGRR
ncbi:hypothetical protein CCR85_08435 [Rhodothalassium salexigens]|nr:hypothetical protein [Rhodothalassium salexigens]